MPFYRMHGMTVHLNLGGRARKNPPKQCVARLSTGEKCCGISTLLCDWKLEEGGTCDAPLCAEHGVAIGPDQHLCPIHERQRRETTPELF